MSRILKFWHERDPRKRGAWGGMAITWKKAEAARRNGKKGGRPRKTQATAVPPIAK